MMIFHTLFERKIIVCTAAKFRRHKAHENTTIATVNTRITATTCEQMRVHCIMRCGGPGSIVCKHTTYCMADLQHPSLIATRQGQGNRMAMPSGQRSGRTNAQSLSPFFYSLSLDWRRRGGEEVSGRQLARASWRVELS